MKAHMQGKLEEYFELLDEVKGKVQDDVTAGRIVSEIAKDMRMEQIREERENKAQPATAKQLQFMKNLKIEIPDGVTKAEASRLIDIETGRVDQE